MTFISFVRSCIDNNSLPVCTVICFTGNIYPILFFSILTKKIRKLYGFVRYIDLSVQSLQEIELQVTTSILGEVGAFWLRSVDELDIKKQKQVADFLLHYRGPHTIFCFFQEKEYTFPHTIEIPLHITNKEAMLVSTLHEVTIDSLRLERYINYIFSLYPSIDLEIWSLLCYYVIHIPFCHKAIIKDICSNVIENKQSLFSLTGYFFDKNIPLFLREWSFLKHRYEPIFWPAYWSDQLWRAVSYMSIAQQYSVVDAKKKVTRLPFSFAQKTWKQYQLPELKKAHNALYLLDTRLKYSNNEYFLEFFYYQFLTNYFQ